MHHWVVSILGWCQLCHEPSGKTSCCTGLGRGGGASFPEGPGQSPGLVVGGPRAIAQLSSWWRCADALSGPLGGQEKPH